MELEAVVVAAEEEATAEDRPIGTMRTTTTRITTLAVEMRGEAVEVIVVSVEKDVEGTETPMETARTTTKQTEGIAGTTTAAAEMMAKDNSPDADSIG